MNDLENRLRDSFAARAEQVTLDSLRRESPPPPPVRRMARWVVPGVTGLAVAATAVGVLVATAPARQITRPAPPAVSVSPQPTRTPIPAPTTPTPTAPTRTASSPADPEVTVPPLVQTLAEAGWRIRVPSTWTSTRQSGARGAAAVCMGTPEQPCLLRLAAGVDAAVRPAPRVLGAGLLPTFAPGCRQVGDASEKDVGGPSAGTTGWTCGPETYKQVTVLEDLLVAVAHTSTSDDPTVTAVIQALRVDAGYTRSFVELTCDDVSFAANSDAIAHSVRAGGLTCADATALVRRLRPEIGVASGPSRVRTTGWSCSVVRRDDGLPVAAVRCSGPGGRELAFRLN